VQIAPAARLDAPRVLVRLAPSEFAAVARARREVLHVARVLAHEVRPRRPDRHDEIERGGEPRAIRAAHAHFDLQEVRVGARHRDRETDCGRRAGGALLLLLPPCADAGRGEDEQ
jgi:hypothetical protein